jgi:hypothetical protein
MTGLPFTSINAGFNSYITTVILQSIPDLNVYAARIGSNTTTVQFVKNNTGGGAGALLGTDFPASGTVSFTLNYFV